MPSSDYSSRPVTCAGGGVPPRKRMQDEFQTPTRPRASDGLGRKSKALAGSPDKYADTSSKRSPSRMSKTPPRHNSGGSRRSLVSSRSYTVGVPFAKGGLSVVKRDLLRQKEVMRRLEVMEGESQRQREQEAKLRRERSKAVQEKRQLALKEEEQRLRREAREAEKRREAASQAARAEHAARLKHQGVQEQSKVKKGAEKKKMQEREQEEQKLREHLQLEERRKQAAELVERSFEKPNTTWGTSATYVSPKRKLNLNAHKIENAVKMETRRAEIENAVKMETRRAEAQQRKEFIKQMEAVEREQELKRQEEKIAAVKARREKEEAEAVKQQKDFVIEGNKKHTYEARLAGMRKTTPVKQKMGKREAIEDFVKFRKSAKAEEERLELETKKRNAEVRHTLAAERLAIQGTLQQKLFEADRVEYEKVMEKNRRKEEEKKRKDMEDWERQRDELLKQEQEKLLVLCHGEERPAPVWGDMGPKLPTKTKLSFIQQRERPAEVLKKREKTLALLTKRAQKAEEYESWNQRKRAMEEEEKRQKAEKRAQAELRRRRAEVRKQRQELVASLERKEEIAEDQMKIETVKARREREEALNQKKRELDLKESNYRRSLAARMAKELKTTPVKKQQHKREESEDAVRLRRAQKDAEELQHKLEGVKRTEQRQRKAKERLMKEEQRLKRLAEQQDRLAREQLIARKEASQEEADRIAREEWEEQRLEILKQEQLKMKVGEDRVAPAWGGILRPLYQRRTRNLDPEKAQRVALREERRLEAIKRKEIMEKAEALEREQEKDRKICKVETVRMRREREQLEAQRLREARIMEANERRTQAALLVVERKTTPIKVKEQLRKREEAEERVLSRRARLEEEEKRVKEEEVQRTKERQRRAAERLAKQEEMLRHNMKMQAQIEQAAVMAKKEAELREELALAKVHREELRMTAKLQAWTFKRMRSIKNMTSGFGSSNGLRRSASMSAAG
eukprot:g39739.t1